MSMIECNELGKRYSTVLALDSVNLSLDKGKIVGLLGPNGSGKTTLIKIATGVLQPTFGKILIDGKEIGVDTKRDVAYLPDRDFLPSYMTPKELCEFYKDFFDDFDQEKANEMLNSLKIEMEMPIKKMSKGTKEKVQLILVMSRNAKVYFLDEPIAGVDPAARDYILKTIISNYCQDSLVVISTHLIADVESILDEAIFIKNGQITMHKPVEQVREEYSKSVDELFREVFKC